MWRGRWVRADACGVQKRIGADVTGTCELPDGDDGDWRNSGPLYKQDELLNTNPSLQLSLPWHLNCGVLSD